MKTTADKASLWPLVLVGGGAALGYAAGDALGWLALALALAFAGLVWFISQW